MTQNWLESALAKMSTRVLPDLAHRYGERFTLPTGKVMQLVAQNDLGVPYFVRVVRGKAQKRQYTVAWIEGDLRQEYKQVKA
jgi:hypothetical protein